MDLVEDFADPAVSMVAACAALCVSRASMYRTTSATATQAEVEEAARQIYANYPAILKALGL